MRKILSVGGRYHEEEIVLLLTLRIQLELVITFLNDHLSMRYTGVLHDIDEELSTLSESSTNGRAFRRATSLIKSNWGLPINSEWLSEG